MSKKAGNKKNEFDKTLKLLSVSKKSTLSYDFLKVLKEQLAWPRCQENILKLFKSGKIKHVVAVLHSSNILIVEEALCVLARFCTDRITSFQLTLEHRIMTHLVQIMEKYPRSDTIQRNVLKLVHNILVAGKKSLFLCQNDEIVHCVIKLLRECADESCSIFSLTTIAYCIKVLRYFYNYLTMKLMLDKTSLLESLAILLIKYSHDWRKKRNQDVLIQVIKFLGKCCNFVVGLNGLDEFIYAQNGDAMKCLIQLLHLKPDKVTRIITYIIRRGNLDESPLLNKMSECYIDILKAAARAKVATHVNRNEINAFQCFLSYPATSEIYMSVVPHLIHAINDFRDISGQIGLECFIFLLQTLDIIGITGPMIKKQIELKAVEILIEKMRSIGIPKKRICCVHENMKSEKIASFRCLQKKSETSGKQTVESAVSLSDVLDEQLPSSSQKPSHCTSFAPGEGDDDATDTNNSDDECFPLNKVKKPERLSFLSEYICQGTESIFENYSVEQLKIKIKSKILSLFAMFYGIKYEASLGVGIQNLLMALLDTLCDGNETLFTDIQVIINSLIRHPGHLVAIMQTEFIPALHWLVNSLSCDECLSVNRCASSWYLMLSKSIESDEVKQIILKEYVQWSSVRRVQLALALPYLKGSIKDLLLGTDSLNILFKLLLSRRCEPRTFRAIRALAVNVFGCSYPRQYPAEELTVGCYTVAADCEDVVTFVLDDGSTVRARRNSLCQKAVYFQSLLNGFFKESGQSHVRLCDIEHKTLNALLDILDRDLDMRIGKHVRLEVEDFLELINVCERYLIIDLCIYLAKCLKDHTLRPSNFRMVYEWAFHWNNDFLRRQCLIYALVTCIEDSELEIVFSDILNSDIWDNFLKDVQNFIVSNLFKRSD